MKRLIVVYNSGSSQYKAVEAEVLAPVRRLKGWMVGKYEVRGADPDKNARKLAEILGDGDLVIVAGGDGTAAIAANGVMLSGKDVVFSALGYGNFNDMAHMLKTKRPVDYGGEFVGGVFELIEKFEAGKIEKIYPLEVLVNKKHWRYAPCYVTVGLFAESTQVFDEKKVREKLRNGRHFPAYSWWVLAKWYFRNRKKREFLPGFCLNGKECLGMTDYIAVNGPKLADVMKGGKWYLEKGIFGSGTYKLSGVWGLFKFMLRSVLVRVPVEETKGDVLDFAKPASMEIQAEGEYERLEDVSRIEVRKVAQGIKVLTF